MKIEILPSAEQSPQQFLSTYLINHTVAIDAGCLGMMPSLAAQRRVEHLFLSHSHLDHLATLPVFLDNVFEPGPKCPHVYGCSATLDSIRTDILNDRLWPDFERLSTPDNRFVELVELTTGESVDVSGLTVTGVPLAHVVPTQGFIVTEGETRVALISDTVACDGLRELLAQSDQLSALFLECSFPNELHDLAQISKHLTPADFASLLADVRADLPILVTHVKPSHYEQTVEQLHALGRSQITIGQPGEAYTF